MCANPSAVAAPVTLYTIREVPATLRVCRSTVNNYIKDGKLRTVKFGHALRFRESDVLAFINGEGGAA